MGFNASTLVTLGLLSQGLVSQQAHADIDYYGFVAAKIGAVDSTSSWLEGGFGRFDSGSERAAGAAPDTNEFANIEAQIAFDIGISDGLLFHGQLLARSENSSAKRDEVGVIEAYFEYDAVDTDENSVRISLGQRFFPTSLENTDDLWQSPYTLSYSAWNSWIAHEFRPIGLQLDYSHLFANQTRVTLRGNTFQGNDSSGAMLAWGGWRVSQRLSLLGEVTPLAPLITLEDTGLFGSQRDDGSKPFGPDLDNKFGYAGQIDIQTEKFQAKFSYVDNKGDKALHRGEYAWHTRFSVLGAKWQPTTRLTVLAEYADGSTAMGGLNGAVKVDFQAAYLMVSYQVEAHRVSLRRDDFKLDDRDGFLTDSSEDGEGWTLAYIYSPGSWRLSAEVSDINVDRIAAAQSGFSSDNDATQLSLEARYVF